MLCLDLDHFKDINDSLGHPVGDALLKEVARRLGECVTENDTVARLGGDEFAIVQFCSDCDPSAVAMLASHVVEQVSAPYEIAGHQLVIGVSIGISLAPEDGKNPDELLKKADLALYRAKEDGRGTYRFFETGMDARAQARRLLELDLRAALQREEFEVHYQPIRDVAKDVVVLSKPWALESFAARHDFAHQIHSAGRRNRPDRAARRMGTAAGLVDAAGWSQDVGVAVDLSPVQFKNPNLVPSVMKALTPPDSRRDGWSWGSPKSVLLQDSEATLSMLHSFAHLASGFRWTISEPAIRP